MPYNPFWPIINRVTKKKKCLVHYNQNPSLNVVPWETWHGKRVLVTQGDPLQLGYTNNCIMGTGYQTGKMAAH